MTTETQAPRPMAAPCRQLPWNAAFTWLRLGWRDLQAAKRLSLGYGLLMTLMSYGISSAAWLFGNIGLYLGVLSGFVFVGPVLAMTLYAVSARLAAKAPMGFGVTFHDARAAVADAMTFALILLIVFLVWARAAAMVHIFFPVNGEAQLLDWLNFLGIGSAVGAVFCGLIFIASAFSLPMMLDRECDTVTAVVSSINAALRNKPAMFVWACCIGAFLLLGLATAYLAFVVLLPWLGHAAWHAYQQAIDAEQWPKRAMQ